MSGPRGFGFTYFLGSNVSESWYCGADGVRRWVHNDLPCEPLSLITPPDPIQHNNTDIQTSESAYYAQEASEGICALPELTDEEMAIANYTQRIC